ncbi:zeta toxin family protein [Metabacillus indicus]|uniref:zeta toxin family protein n=1 Tax=Metabacillus indicus TaxID=246786 RepID=UPI00068AF889|nr:zeta toxin family protein [Metabacillus indicus]
MENLKTTKDIFCVDGEYIEERQALHADIIRMFINDAGENPEVGEKEAIILGGGSGSGKSFVVEEILGIEGYVVVDSDKIKKVIPEYQEARSLQDYRAADIVHGESSDISMALLEYAAYAERSLIYDGTMKNLPKYESIVYMLKDRGYTVQLIIVDADVEVALDRVKQRFADPDDRRFVPEEIVRESNSLVARTFIELRRLCDSYVIFNNSVNGEPPREIAFMDENEGEVIVDSEGYSTFLNKFKLPGFS